VAQGVGPEFKSQYWMEGREGGEREKGKEEGRRRGQERKKGRERERENTHNSIILTNCF
jgi:hypothetical protein